MSQNMTPITEGELLIYPAADGLAGIRVLLAGETVWLTQAQIAILQWIANGKEPEKLILTAGQVALRDNYETVRKDLGIE